VSRGQREADLRDPDLEVGQGLPLLHRRTRRSLGNPPEWDLGPGDTNISRENQVVPHVDEQGAVDVGQYVTGGCPRGARSRIRGRAERGRRA
jgi:hypothetical protein